MDGRETTRKIWEKFHIHKGDNLPISSWLEGASRMHLAELFAELGFNEGAEIGVRSGNYSLELLSKNPNLHMRCIDTWAAYLKVSQERQDAHYRHCVAKLAPYKADIMRMSSMQALSLVDDDSLDFVYIDGRHDFPFVIQDLIGWSKKVKQGGIISGHDYYPFYQGGVMLAVDAFTRAYNIQQWFVTKEREASFFWVKEYRDIV
jgi:hypothetical protein